MPGNYTDSGLQLETGNTSSTLAAANSILSLNNTNGSAGVTMIAFGFPVAGVQSVLAAIVIGPASGTMTFVCQENGSFYWENSLGSEMARLEPSSAGQASINNPFTLVIQGLLKLSNTVSGDMEIYIQEVSGVPQLIIAWAGQTYQVTNFTV